MKNTNTDKRMQRYYWIDTLRGIAALSIVIFHYHHFYLSDAFDRPNLPEIQSFPYASVFSVIYGPLGAKAVELFWMISGFVFAHVYLQKPVSLWQFSVTRIARLYPLHILLLVIVAALQWISLSNVGHWQVYANNDPRHFGLHLIMASNWSSLSRGLSFNGPFWSVSLEILVYGFFFVSLFFLRRAPLLVSAVLAGASWTIALTPDLSIPLVQQAVFLCSGYFFLGSFLYSLSQTRSQNTWVATALIGAGIVLGSAGLLQHHDVMATGGICTAILIGATLLDRHATATGKRFRSLGDMSYSLYLIHVPLQIAILLIADLAFSGDRSFAGSPLVLPLYVLTSLILAHLAFRWYEKPARASIRRLLERSGPIPANTNNGVQKIDTRPSRDP